MLARKEDRSLKIISGLLVLAALLIVWKLFLLQILSNDFYAALAQNTHEIYRQLNPKRGNIYFSDARGRAEYPAAISRLYYLVYGVPRDISRADVASTAVYLAGLLKFDPDEAKELEGKLKKADDPYEPIASKVEMDVVDKIKDANLKGINFAGREYRYYPEKNSAAHVLGFVGANDVGDLTGRYGLEGAWDSELAGRSGFLAGSAGALGGWIPLAGRTLRKAVNGTDFVLTVDRALQYRACDKLRAGLEEFKAKSAALVLMEAKSGAVLAMCSLPDFDPNDYGSVKDVSYFNNTAIFTAYEPGSVFKPVTMAIGLELGLVEPETVFTDPGERVINDFKIHNALNKKYGTVSMTKVLENSINTGMIWVEEKIGPLRFKEYVEKFGFGAKTGVNLDTESAGDISSFDKKAPIYNANASFGQGFTATPIQLAAAYAALATGRLPRPNVLKETRAENGKIDRPERESAAVISARTQKLITAMLISVVENGSGYKKAKLNDYFAAGKTGTAQIARQGKYGEESNHTFAGYFPATDPRFVLVVKYEAPQRQWAESTAAPVFREVAKLTLEYFGIARDK
ncbi:penicillin-binding protein 2 [Patescibacteria group bacterium]|nr:MAG: penicillin-binding protein 2 [Patescibacteria group bacterium]